MQSVVDQSVNIRGHPRIGIDSNQLCYLVECGFRVRDIALILGCSKCTIERRMNELGLHSGDYSTITDDELDYKIANFLSMHRLCGEKSISGLLRSEDCKVQRQRIRDSIRRVDPVGIELQSRITLHRRTYQVQTHKKKHCSNSSVSIFNCSV